MAEKFCTRLLERRPDLVGRSVWLFVNQKQRLKCIINDDGTVSAVYFPQKRFKTAKDMIKEIASGSLPVEDDFNLPRKIPQCFFSSHLYVSSNRSHQVNYFIQNPSLPLPPEPDPEKEDGTCFNTKESTGPSTSSNTASYICPGFTSTDPLLHSIDCTSIKNDRIIFRSRYCNGKKRMEVPMCKDCVRGRCVVKQAVKRVKLDLTQTLL